GPRVVGRAPGPRGGGQCRGDAGRRGGRARRRHDPRPDEPAELDAVSREPALRTQRDGTRPAPGTRGGAEPPLRRRNHRRRLRHAEGGGACMSAQLVTELTILVLAAVVGFEVISRVRALLHPPLMSGTNAIHGIVIVGAIIVMGTPHPGLFMRILSFVAVVLASANVVGGFVVTDRMLEMFKKRPDDSQGERLQRTS